MLVALGIAGCGRGDDRASDSYTFNFGADSEPTPAPTPPVSASSREDSAATARSTTRDPGQLVVSGMNGHRPSSQILRAVRRGRIAGVILMGPNIETVPQVAAITSELRRAAKDVDHLPPLVMVDQEGGTGERFRSAAPHASAESLGAQSESAIKEAGHETGNDLKARGVNIDLASVADVRRSRKNFLRTRTFGSDPAAVAGSVCVFASGLVGSGIGATFKHFPGLGRARATNTDAAPVSIGESYASLAKYWAPYRACAKHKNTLVMVSNASYPSAFGRDPAVVTPSVYEALRGELGFGGVIVSDSLAAGALDGISRPASAAIRAGADLALYVDESSGLAASAELRSDYKRNAISRDRIAEAASRVRALRAALK